MAKSGLSGPYPLTHEDINTNVTHVSPGAYVLGQLRDGTFYITRVGRSDSDVNDRLHDHIGNYRQFKFGYFDSPNAAFLKECELYHDFDPPDNKIHPDRPTGCGWECPQCNIFD